MLTRYISRYKLTKIETSRGVFGTLPDICDGVFSQKGPTYSTGIHKWLFGKTAILKISETHNSVLLSFFITHRLVHFVTALNLGS